MLGSFYTMPYSCMRGFRRKDKGRREKNSSRKQRKLSFLCDLCGKFGIVHNGCDRFPSSRIPNKECKSSVRQGSLSVYR